MFCSTVNSICPPLETQLSKKNHNVYTRSKWFLEGFPSTLRTGLFYRYILDWEEDMETSFDNLLEKKRAFIGSKKQLVDIDVKDRVNASW